MKSDGSTREVPPADQPIYEDDDGRKRWDPETRYSDIFRDQQKHEAWYMFGLMLGSCLVLAGVSLGLLDWLPFGPKPKSYAAQVVRGYCLLSAGGLLGGTVYDAKWLYHAVAKGLWHKDRQIWRYLSPWTSLGTTVGVGALIHAGLLRNVPPAVAPMSGSALVGLGFLAGYFADKALAKMRDITDVLFGETRPQLRDDSRKNSPD